MSNFIYEARGMQVKTCACDGVKRSASKKVLQAAEERSARCKHLLTSKQLPLFHKLPVFIFEHRQCVNVDSGDGANCLILLRKMQQLSPVPTVRRDFSHSLTCQGDGRL